MSPHDQPRSTAEPSATATGVSAPTCPSQRHAYPPIAEYALVGDCHGAALVHACGSIDWACIRRFDGGSVFGRLLDEERGGYFSLCARGATATRRRYLDGTMVLETHVSTHTGEARVFDCFSMRPGGKLSPHRQLIRVIEGVRGSVTFDVEIVPRFDYGDLRPWIHYIPTHRVFTAIGGDDALVISATCDFAIDTARSAILGELEVREARRAQFAVAWQPTHAINARKITGRQVDQRLATTLAWWRQWSARGDYAGPYREAVTRSALVLKTLTSARTGAIVAAPTTSLPEAPGGTRNWDYRYSWIRDSAFTLAALCNVGHPEVANAFIKFLEHATAGHADDMQIMYGCYGERRLIEWELNLNGYRGSRPVRVGNAASTQKQIDIYGELLNALSLWWDMGYDIDRDDWAFIQSVASEAARVWPERDHGFWEVRCAPRDFVYSKVMCWVALDRAIHLARARRLPADLEAWDVARTEVRRAIDVHGVDPKRGCFVQAFGSTALDASLLLLPVMGFCEPLDPRMLATVKAIEEDLTIDGYVMRYRPDQAGDGIGGQEGSLLMCTFWLAECLALQGRVSEARTLFERTLLVANDVGLLAEEYDPESKNLLGNFPLAFTHVALINAAVTLSRTQGGSIASTTGATHPKRSVTYRTR